uniref:Uncharacterized protein n=1 Tax=Sphaerodactylus townsendi TaxID=933632 RepID=A0ACB8EJP6_9SAUR
MGLTPCTVGENNSTSSPLMLLSVPFSKSIIALMRHYLVNWGTSNMCLVNWLIDTCKTVSAVEIQAIYLLTTPHRMYHNFSSKIQEALGSILSSTKGTTMKSKLLKAPP